MWSSPVNLSCASPRISGDPASLSPSVAVAHPLQPEEPMHVLCWPRAALPDSCPSAGLSPDGSLRARGLPRGPCSRASHRPRALPCRVSATLSPHWAHTFRPSLVFLPPSAALPPPATELTCALGSLMRGSPSTFASPGWARDGHPGKACEGRSRSRSPGVSDGTVSSASLKSVCSWGESKAEFCASAARGHQALPG